MENKNIICSFMNNKKQSVAMVEIYQPTRNAMQSAFKQLSKWKIRYQKDLTTHYEPLMNWIASDDSNRYVQLSHLSFNNLESAVSFAKKQSLQYYITNPEGYKKKFKKKSYANNF